MYQREFQIPFYYRIHVSGEMDRGWSSRLNEFLISPKPDNSTLLSGVVNDQVELHGLLAKLLDLGLTLLSIKREDCLKLGIN
jgi:hypothetical protein